jgi:UDP-N-acetylglucosamine--dolichyl-phosphate N-acetylglucosaminephosphotransferase
MEGWLYYGYMAFLSIFCTNTINILAGVNGLEAGQSIIIAICIVLNDLLYLMQPAHPARDAHLFSIYFLLPFIAVSLGLLYHNWYFSYLTH